MEFVVIIKRLLGWGIVNKRFESSNRERRSVIRTLSTSILLPSFREQPRDIGERRVTFTFGNYN
jgi:hypothetical protein